MLNKVIANEISILSQNKKHHKYSEFHPEIQSYINALGIKIKPRTLIAKCSLLRKFNDFLNSILFDSELSSLQDIHINQYKEFIVEYKPQYQINILCIVKSLFHFIGIFKFDHSLLIQVTTEIEKEKIKNPKVKDENKKILEFISYIKEFKKFSQPYTNKKHLNMFYKFLKQYFPELNMNEQSDFSEVELHHVKSFQRYQLERVSIKKISKIYVYLILRSVRMLFDYLRKKDILELKYVPPSYLQRNRNRANEYVEEKDIKAMINTFFNQMPTTARDTRYLHRNLAIFLIILNTGCRPIEVCNLTITDVWLNEGTIQLKSKKSGQRKLKLDREVVFYIKYYLNIRGSFQPKCDNLFLKKDGTAIDYSILSKAFRKLNKKTFNQIVNTPKSFRHTYITNALESLNDIKKVAEAAGHKIWSSTDYYRYKSIDRLIKNTSKNDPTELYEKEFEYGHS